MVTGVEILTKQYKAQQRLANVRASAALNMLNYLNQCSVFGGLKPKLRIDLDTGNIFRDAFQFLWPLQWEYPESTPAIGIIAKHALRNSLGKILSQPIKIRKPITIEFNKPERPVLDIDQVKKHINVLSGITRVSIGKPNGKPRPIFEIRYRDRDNFNIYEDGTIEGFPEGAMICNRIPAMMYQRIATAGKEVSAGISQRLRDNL